MLHDDTQCIADSSKYTLTLPPFELTVNPDTGDIFDTS